MRQWGKGWEESKIEREGGGGAAVYCGEILLTSLTLNMPELLLNAEKQLIFSKGLIYLLFLDSFFQLS